MSPVLTEDPKRAEGFEKLRRPPAHHEHSPSDVIVDSAVGWSDAAEAAG